MRRQSGRVDRQRARRLDGVSELEPERLPQPRSAFRDVDVKRDRLPGLENRAVTLRQRSSPARSGPVSTSAIVIVVTAKRRRPDHGLRKAA
jgi:hypothetical protein